MRVSVGGLVHTAYVSNAVRATYLLECCINLRLWTDAALSREAPPSIEGVRQRYKGEEHTKTWSRSDEQPTCLWCAQQRRRW